MRRSRAAFKLLGALFGAAVLVLIATSAPQGMVFGEVHHAYAKNAKSGWVLKGSKLCHYTKGERDKAQVVEGIRLDSKGVAVKNTASRLKIACMKKVRKITSKSMSRKQKLRACFNASCRLRHTGSSPTYIGKRGWVQRCALRAFDTGHGECYGKACYFAALAFELGYEPIVHEARRGHAYTLIGKKEWDYYGMGYRAVMRVPLKKAKWKLTSWSNTTPKSDAAIEKEKKAKSMTKLVKKKKGLVYYKAGKQVFEAWVNVKKKRYYFDADGYAVTGPAKIGSKHYVFGANGVLKRGKKTRVVTVEGVAYRVTAKGCAASGWTASHSKLYLANGAQAKGACVYAGKLNAFTSAGIYDADATAKLRAAARSGQECSALLGLLGRYDDRKESATCYSMPDPETGDLFDSADSKDVVYTYRNLIVYTYLAPNGKEYLESYEAR